MINAMDQNTMRELQVNPENLATLSVGHVLFIDGFEPDTETPDISYMWRPWFSWNYGHEVRLPTPIPFLRHELRRDQDLTPCSIQIGELDATIGRKKGVDSSSSVRRRSDAFGLPFSNLGLFAIETTSPSDFRRKHFVV